VPGSGDGEPVVDGLRVLELLPAWLIYREMAERPFRSLNMIGARSG
jgi:hypothetical protein